MLRRSKTFSPTLARLCLVSTFVEDGIRMWFQWSEQRDYMNSQWGCGWFLATIFVLTNMLAQLIGSGLVLTRFHVPIACAVLFGTVVLQVCTDNQLISQLFLDNGSYLHLSFFDRPLRTQSYGIWTFCCEIWVFAVLCCCCWPSVRSRVAVCSLVCHRWARIGRRRTCSWPAEYWQSSCS